MIVEKYKGCKIRAVKGKGWEWGRTHVVLNGVKQGTYEGNEATAIDSVKRTIDHAEQTGPGEARYGAEWYTPGTYALCPEGHVTAIGGQCGHHWCAKHRNEVAT